MGPAVADAAARDFPGPIETTRALWGEIAGGRVGTDVAMTLLRVGAGLLLALLLGVPVGILMGMSRRAEAVLDVWVMVGLTVPSLCYAIVAFMWFGLNEGAAIIAIAVTAAPSITINIWEGVKNIDTKLVAMARVFEASRPAIVRRMLVPQIFPYVMASARFGLGIIWKITVLVELIGRPNGVGFKLFYWYQLADMRQVLAWTLLFTIIMLVIELLIFKPIETCFPGARRWQYESGHRGRVPAQGLHGPRRHAPYGAERSRSGRRRGRVPVRSGASGCGKSTLLNMLAGLDKVYEGRVSLRAAASATYSRSRVSCPGSPPTGTSILRSRTAGCQPRAGAS